jgi:hypothetical protein
MTRVKLRLTTLLRRLLENNKLTGCFNGSQYPASFDPGFSCHVSSNFFCCTPSSCNANNVLCVNDPITLINMIVNGSYPAVQIGQQEFIGLQAEGFSAINTVELDCSEYVEGYYASYQIALDLGLEADPNTTTVELVNTLIDNTIYCPASKAQIVLAVFNGDAIYAVVVDGEISLAISLHSTTNTGNSAVWNWGEFSVQYTDLPGISVAEASALVDLAQTCELVPPGWNIALPQTACSWDGVQCSNQHVQTVYVYLDYSCHVH